MRAIELFAGAGGMALGAESAGFAHEALVEVDGLACETLRMNRPAWPVLEADVQLLGFAQYAGIDLLTAGAPCQPFSTAGKRELDGDERDMFREVRRAVREIRPRALLLENVKGLQLGGARVSLQRLLARLDVLGYDASCRLLNCADYGVPQRRERLFIVGFRRDLGVSWRWPAACCRNDALLYAKWIDGSYWEEHGIPEPGEPPLSDLKRLERDWPSVLAPPGRRWRTVRDALADSRLHILDGPTTDARFHVLDEPARTITTRREKALLRTGNDLLRELSVTDLARIQSFPEEWAFAGGTDEQIRQIGNAVPTEVARVLISAIADSLSVRGEARPVV